MDPMRPLSEEAKRLQPGIYRHFKGMEYKLLHIARFEDNLEEAVVYQALYGEHGIWIRKVDDFIADVTMPDGSVVPRFKFLRDL